MGKFTERKWGDGSMANEEVNANDWQRFPIEGKGQRKTLKDKTVIVTLLLSLSPSSPSVVR